MNSKQAVMLRVCLNKFHPNSTEDILKNIPIENSKLALSEKIVSQNLQEAFPDPHRFIERLHYSWLVSSLKKVPPSLLPFVISSFPQKTVDILKEHIPALPSPQPLSPPMKTFFLNKFLVPFFDEHHLPLEYIPETPLSPLKSWTKKDLENLMDILGLYDLAPEVRQIVDKLRIKRLYQSLTKSQQQYLRQVLHHQDKVVVPRMGLDQLSRDASKLKNEIHRRGLIRFSKALSGQHPDFVWHLCHLLDTGRSAILLKNMSKEEIPGVTSIMIFQLMNAINFLKNPPK